jgi:hypothetical protein
MISRGKNTVNANEQLLKYGKKTISLEDIKNIMKISIMDEKNAYEMISEMISEEIIEPVKSSGKNGNLSYPLYKKYRILVKEEADQGVIDNIRQLHPLLLRSGYLSSKQLEFQSNRAVIEKVSAYLFFDKDDTFISRKERSFEIFGHEKTLDNSMVKALLRKLQITEYELGFYDTPEYCFHDYIPLRKEQMVLLICENKDIWFNIRRLMFEDGVRSLFGTAIDGVVYGEGNKVSDRTGALEEYVKFMGEPEVKFLYWGDIDREGFDIFRRTKEANDRLDISLFVPGYRKMIERARNIELEDSSSSKKQGMSFNDFINDFADDERTFLADIFDNNKLIPQEIISYKYLKEGYIRQESIKVRVYKIDMNSANSVYKGWEETLTQSSGAEKFVVFFSVVLTLMNYTRSSAGLISKNIKSVLILDNPFGKITSAHLLKPMFDIAKHFNVQLICLSDINKSDVVGCFDCVIKLVIKAQSLSNFEIMTHEGNERIEHGYYKIMNGQMSLF